MHLHGIIQTATLQEVPPESGNLEIVLKVQGVGPGHPRTLVIPHALLVVEESLDPDALQGHAFDAEVDQDRAGRWVVSRLQMASSRVLRPPE